MDFKWICLLTSKKYSLLRGVSNSNILISPKCVPTSKEKVWWNVHAFQKKWYEWNDCTLEYLNTTIKIPRRKSRSNLRWIQSGRRKVILFILLKWIILNRIFQEERKMRLVKRMFNDKCYFFISFEMKRWIVA